MHIRQIFTLVLLTLSVTAAAAPGVGETLLLAQAAPVPPARIQPEELSERLAAGSPPVLLDVRTPREFALGRLEGAVNVPVQELRSRYGELLSVRDREIVVYCESGPRARSAYAFLQHLGFERLRLLEGHTRAWRAARRPLVKGAPE